MAVYVPTLRFQFVHDDLSYIVANYRAQSWSYLPGYFTTHLWAHVYGVAQANYYRPLFLVWLLLNHTLFGLDPLGWRLTTVLAHLAAASLVYALARQLLADLRAAALAALVFALHPAQVESVAWVCGVSEPLQAILVLGGLLAYLQFDQLPDPRPRFWLVVSLLTYFIGLLLKEGAVILPGVVFLYSVSLGRAADRGLIRRTALALRPCLLYAMPLAAYFLLRMWALHGPWQARMKVPLGTALLTLPSWLWFYATHLLALTSPAKLALNYYTPYVQRPGLDDFYLPLAGVLLIVAALCWWGWRSRLAAFCALWIAVTLALPLAGAGMFPYGDLVHDRYLYLPVAGLALLLGEAYRRLSLWRPGALPAAAAAAVAVLLGWQTLSYEPVWSSNLTLYRRSVEVSPDALLPKVLLASAVQDQGQALRLLREAEAASGGHWLAEFALGEWCSRNGRYPEAEQYFLRSIQRNPEIPIPYYDLGEVRLKMGQPERAVAPLQRAVQMVPKSVHYRLRYATALELAGDLAGALREYQNVANRLPDEPILRWQVARLQRALAAPRKGPP